MSIFAVKETHGGVLVYRLDLKLSEKKRKKKIMIVVLTQSLNLSVNEIMPSPCTACWFGKRNFCGGFISMIL